MSWFDTKIVDGLTDATVDVNATIDNFLESMIIDNMCRFAPFAPSRPD